MQEWGKTTLWIYFWWGDDIITWCKAQERWLYVTPPLKFMVKDILYFGKRQTKPFFILLCLLGNSKKKECKRNLSVKIWCWHCPTLQTSEQKICLLWSPVHHFPLCGGSLWIIHADCHRQKCWRIWLQRWHLPLYRLCPACPQTWHNVKRSWKKNSTRQRCSSECQKCANWLKKQLQEEDCTAYCLHIFISNTSLGFRAVTRNKWNKFTYYSLCSKSMTFPK